jgi:hypothetical protein
VLLYESSFVNKMYGSCRGAFAATAACAFVMGVCAARLWLSAAAARGTPVFFEYSEFYDSWQST